MKRPKSKKDKYGNKNQANALHVWGRFVGGKYEKQLFLRINKPKKYARYYATSIVPAIIDQLTKTSESKETLT